MLFYADAKVGEGLKGGPQLDRDATLRLASKRFPKDRFESIGEGDLSFTCPPDNAREGPIDATLLQSESVPLVKYKRRRFRGNCGETTANRVSGVPHVSRRSYNRRWILPIGGSLDCSYAAASWVDSSCASAAAWSWRDCGRWIG